ncbi:MAG: rhamnulokinase family protein [Planctomycetota bacterium]
MGGRAYVAIDLGAGSGRVILGRLAEGDLELEIVHRFAPPMGRADGHDRWLLGAMLAEIERGLAGVAQSLRARPASLASIGVDSWAVDHALLDSAGELLADPVRYRDARTEGMLEVLDGIVPPRELFARTGIQRQPFNTLVQLFAQVRAGEWPPAARRLLMIPDLVHRHLGGKAVTERTNASTTQAYDPRVGTWDDALLRTIGVPPEVMPEIVEPGTELGRLRSRLAERLGLPAVPIVCPATHDTASAVAAIPLEADWAYVSSGTWSLVGAELAAPLLTEEARAAGFTNEAGVGGTTRFLVNCMGLWILESCRAVWERQGELLPWDDLLACLADAPAPPALLDPDDPRFLNPPDMIAAIEAHLAERGAVTPRGQIAWSRLILDSLAGRYARILALLAAATGRPRRGVHVVGGGSRNAFLNQATADATGLPVRAGPVEATAIGNVLVQAIHDGAFPDLAAARRFVARRFPPEELHPR